MADHSPATPRTITQMKVDSCAKRFAKHTGMSMDDPIIQNLKRDLRLTFGRIDARNRRKANEAARQPKLFTTKADLSIDGMPHASNCSAKDGKDCDCYEC